MQEARYIFGVAEVDRQEPFVSSGFSGEPVRLVGQGHRRVAVQRCAPDFLAGRPEHDLTAALLVHHRVLHHLLAYARSLVPARFGTLVAGDDRAAADWLARSRRSLRPALQRVSGCWEVAVTVARLPGAPAGPERAAGGDLPPGTAFLLGRLSRERAEGAREREAGQLRQELMAELEPLLVGCRTEAIRDGDVIARLSCLIRRQDHEQFTRQLHAAAAARSLMVTQCEALPPYSFVSLESAAPGRRGS